MSGQGFRRKRQPFHEQLRSAIERLQVSQSIAAEMLGVSRNTVESWLALPGSEASRVPHHLTQIGALFLLSRRKSERVKTVRAGGQHIRWRVSANGGWVRGQVGEERLSTVYQALVTKGAHAATGLRAERVTVDLRDPDTNLPPERPQKPRKRTDAPTPAARS